MPMTEFLQSDVADNLKKGKMKSSKTKKNGEKKKGKRSSVCLLVSKTM